MTGTSTDRQVLLLMWHCSQQTGVFYSPNGRVSTGSSSALKAKSTLCVMTVNAAHFSRHRTARRRAQSGPVKLVSNKQNCKITFRFAGWMEMTTQSCRAKRKGSAGIASRQGTEPRAEMQKCFCGSYLLTSSLLSAQR